MGDTFFSRLQWCEEFMLKSSIDSIGAQGYSAFRKMSY
jgi:hypothetical protein